LKKLPNSFNTFIASSLRDLSKEEKTSYAKEEAASFVFPTPNSNHGKRIRQTAVRNGGQASSVGFGSKPHRKPSQNVVSKPANKVEKGDKR